MNNLHDIWLPSWLYHLMPKASLAIGAFGLLLVPEHTLLTASSATASLVYGLTISIVRAEHKRGFGHGW